MFNEDTSPIKRLLAIGATILCINAAAKDIQHEAAAINIEVPVRVFKGDTFIDNLTEVAPHLARISCLPVQNIKPNRISSQSPHSIKSS